FPWALPEGNPGKRRDAISPTDCADRASTPRSRGRSGSSRTTRQPKRPQRLTCPWHRAPPLRDDLEAAQAECEPDEREDRPEGDRGTRRVNRDVGECPHSL